MSVAMAQPIAGVSANRETEIEVVYPSVAAGAIGRLVGAIMGIPNSVPITLFRVIALVIVGAAMLPLALLAYALNKLFGKCYVLTNRSVYPRPIIGSRPGARVPLGSIDDITIAENTGYNYHRVGDLRLKNAQGSVLLTIPAIPFPERLRQIIFDARNARQQSDDSLAQIQARK